MNPKTHTVRTNDGRTLTVFEAGQQDGFPIFALHGTPGSRLLNPLWAADAQMKGIRLISYDRAGYGGSTPHPNRSVASASKDVAIIAENLKLKNIGVWGVSGGGPHALACAALLPGLVSSAAALASPAPYHAEGLDWFAGMGQDNLDEFGAALEGKMELEVYIQKEIPALLTADPKELVEALLSILCPPDVAVLTEDNAKIRLAAIREGIKDSSAGWVDDDLAFVKPWGFELNQIKIPVLVMHGEQDQVVPIAHGLWLAERIPTAEKRMLPEDGHLTLSANRIPEVHTWLLKNKPSG